VNESHSDAFELPAHRFDAADKEKDFDESLKKVKKDEK
jgi:hypothetical protein